MHHTFITYAALTSASAATVLGLPPSLQSGPATVALFAVGAATALVGAVELALAREPAT